MEHMEFYRQVSGRIQQGKAQFLAMPDIDAEDIIELLLPGKREGDGLYLMAMGHGIDAPGWVSLRAGNIVLECKLEVDTYLLQRFRQVLAGGTRADYGDEFSDFRFSVQYPDGEPILCGTYWQNFDGAHSGVSFEVPLDLPAGTPDAPTAPLGELGEGLDC